jgi:Domain of unknown function (DUF892)
LAFTPLWLAAHLVAGSRSARAGDLASPELGAHINPRSDVVGLFSKDIKTMDVLLLHGLKDIYYAENQIAKALPKMIDKATNRNLKKGLKDHLEERSVRHVRAKRLFMRDDVVGRILTTPICKAALDQLRRCAPFLLCASRSIREQYVRCHQCRLVLR